MIDHVVVNRADEGYIRCVSAERGWKWYIRPLSSAAVHPHCQILLFHT